MSKWFITGIAAAAGIFLSALYFSNSRKFSDNDGISEESGYLDYANDYLINAREKARNMIKNAEEKSEILINEAGRKLSEVKELTEQMHKKISEGSIEEAMKIKNEVENLVYDFKNKLI